MALVLTTMGLVKLVSSLMLRTIILRSWKINYLFYFERVNVENTYKWKN